VHAVEAALRVHASVRDCAVIAVADDERGHRLIAFACGESLDAQALAASVTEQLGSAARPRIVTTIDQLPLLAGGKIDRQALIALARETR